MDPLTLAVVSTVVAWSITGVATFTWRAYYTRRAIENDIRRHQARMVDLHEYLFVFARKWLKTGEIIETSAYYDRGDHSLYTALVPEIVKLSPVSLERITLFHEAVRTVDALVANFWCDISKDKERKTPLTTERVQYYLTKIGRIIGYTDTLVGFDGSIPQLPAEYNEVSSAEVFRRIEAAYGAWKDEDRIILLEAQDFTQPRLSVRSLKRALKPSPHDATVPPPPADTTIDVQATSGVSDTLEARDGNSGSPSGAAG